MKIIDGKGAVLGRLASFAAKEALKGEEIAVLNCAEVIITGNPKEVAKKWQEKRGRIGSGFGGPKHSRLSDKIVKRTIRGMLPDHREGRGKEILKKIKCYVGTPKEFEDKKKISSKREEKHKFTTVKELGK